MGAFGAGLSTLIARTIMPIAYVIYMLSHNHYKKYFKFFSKANFSFYTHKSIAKLGLPIAIQLSLECVSFSMVTIMMGWLSTVALAAYQIVLTFCTLTFQIACGVASSTTILVSHSFGRKDGKDVSAYSNGGLHLSFITMGIAALCFIFFGRQITSWFSTDATVIAQGALLFIVAGGFQLIDGTQATLLGALRGINDVSKPMKYSLISYILFAIPMAYVLGFLLDFGPCGILSGEALGLLLAAILYYQRYTLFKLHNILLLSYYLHNVASGYYMKLRIESLYKVQIIVVCPIEHYEINIFDYYIFLYHYTVLVLSDFTKQR